MNATILKLCCAGVLAMGMGACASHKGHSDHAGEHAGESACADCARGKAGEAVWCADCSAGFVDGEKVKCEGCFAAKTGGPACEACGSK
jgi:hypothetical protein